MHAITSMDEDFAKWYTDICKKAELVEYTSVKGCMVIPTLRLRYMGEYPDIYLTHKFKETRS